MFSLSLLAALCALTTGAPAYASRPAATQTSIVRPLDAAGSQIDRLVELTNLSRSRAGLPSLVVNERLNAAACAHARDMATRGYFDHMSPNGDGPDERCRRAGYADFSGENICMGTRSARATVDLWMTSAGHRQNILAAGSREIGVGFAKSAAGRIYWVQLFGTRTGL